MATDPQTLLAAANCYLCYGKPGLLELALVNQWAQNAQGGSSGNLIPPGAVYNNNGAYQISGVLGGVYQWTKNADDSSITDGIQFFTSSTSFTSQGVSITLGGTPFTTVTATLVRTG